MLNFTADIKKETMAKKVGKDYCYVLIKNTEPAKQCFGEYEDAVAAYNDAKGANPMLFKEYFLGGTIQIM